MKKKIKMTALIKAYHDTKFDPNGSYTGKPKSNKEKPVQDADDL